MKRVLTTFVLLSSLIGLASCGHPQPANSKTITLSFWTLQLLNFKDTLQPMIDEYEAQHPNIKIQWVDIPFSEGEKRTLTAMMSSQVPDVVNLNPDFSATLASRNAILNMNKAVPAQIRQTYVPAVWQAVSMGDIAVGLPWYITSSVTLYNQALLKQVGYKHPPANYSQLQQFAQVLQQKTGHYALMPSLTENGNFFKELKKAGIEPFDQQGKAVFAENGAAQVLSFWQTLYKNHWIPAESINEGHQAAVDRYQAGSLAMLLSGANFLKIVKENAPDVFKNTQVTSQFPQEGRFVDFSTMLLVVPQKSQHPKEAVDFALFITNRANQLKFAQAAPVLPSIQAALQDPYFQSHPGDNLLDQGRSVSAQQLLKAKQASPIQPQQKERNEVMDYYVQSAFLGKLSAQQAMAKAEEQINQMRF